MWLGRVVAIPGQFTSRPLSAEADYDSWISAAEDAYADSQGTTVGGVFGQHTAAGAGGSRTFAFQDQVGSGNTGLPNDGQITVNMGGNPWEYQLLLDRDAEPDGGYSEGNIPTQPNSINVSNYSGTTAVTDSILLNSGDQGNYSGVNLLFTANASSDGNKYTEIVANYSDLSSEVIYRNPASGQSTSGGVVADFNNLGSASSDVMLAYQVTHHWSQTGSTSAVRNGDRYMYTFADSLPVDSTKTLTSLDIAVLNTKVNRGNRMLVYAISAVPEPGALALVLLGLLAVVNRRRR